MMRPPSSTDTLAEKRLTRGMAEAFDEVGGGKDARERQLLLHLMIIAGRGWNTMIGREEDSTKQTVGSNSRKIHAVGSSEIQ